MRRKTSVYNLNVVAMHVMSSVVEILSRIWLHNGATPSQLFGEPRRRHHLTVRARQRLEENSLLLVVQQILSNVFAHHWRQLMAVGVIVLLERHFLQESHGVFFHVDVTDVAD